MSIPHDSQCLSAIEALVDIDTAFSSSSLISSPVSAQSETSHPLESTDSGMCQKSVQVKDMASNSLPNTPENSATSHQSDETFLSASEIRSTGLPSKTSDAQYIGKTQEFSSNENKKAEKVSKVYSIRRLKEISQATKDTSVLVKVKPEAISENLFQYLGIRRERRHTVRPRGFSNISTFSCSSDQSNFGDGSNFPRQRSFYQPTRQPYQPPPSATSQKSDGFLRFLQQHASPSHHRVTAGGRIVPAGPFSPPPMFDFASLSGMVHSDGTKMQGHTRYPDNKIHLPRSSNNIFSHSGTSSTGVGCMQMPVPPNCIPYMAPLPSNPQAPNMMTPLGQLSDGTPVVSYNGLCYRSFWSNDNIIMEPLTLPVPTHHTEEERVWSRQPQPYNPAFPLSSMASLENEMPSTSGINLHLPRPKSPITSEQLADSAKEAILRQELANLNVYMALHHDVIEPDERLKLVEKRKHLVGRLDHIRVSREPSTVKMPIVAPINLNRHPAIWAEPAAPLEKPDSAGSATDINGALLREGNEQGRIKKMLSPNAPSFIPSGLDSRNLAVHGLFSTSQAASANLTTPQRQEATNIKAIHTPVPNGKRQMEEGSIEEEQQYSPPDPRDPAMRIVHRDDIKYATKFEKSKGAKLFCTTLEEFQEAIRQVREQARLYGCAGGSSKDPAYDAEQDIWWAICDHDPIPLPSVVPDYVARPRPWAWNNSAFNARCIDLERVRYHQDHQGAQERNRRTDQSVGRKKEVLAGNTCSAPLSVRSGEFQPDEDHSLQAFAEKAKHYDLNELGSALPFKEAASKDAIPKKLQDPDSNRSYQAYVEDAPPSPIKSGNHSVPVKEAVVSSVPHCFAFHKDFNDLGNPKETDSIYKSDEAYVAEILKVCDSHAPSEEQASQSASEESTMGYGSQLEQLSGATSRTVWGPEEVSLATHNLNRPESSHDANNSNLALAEPIFSKPRVSIPSSESSKPLYGQRFYASINGKKSMCPEPHIVHDANFVEVTTHRQEGQPDVNSPSFLQDMLKNPKYTYDFRHVDNTPMDPSTAWQIAKREKEFREILANSQLGKRRPTGANTDQEISNTRASNKENHFFSNISSARDTKDMGNNTLSPLAGKLQSHLSPKASASKSNSSLASSTYQARGYLPPYEGAGKAHTSTIYHQHGCGLQPCPRVNLPQASSFGGMNEQSFPDEDTEQKSKSEVSNGHRPFGSFGLDGSADSPPKSVAEVKKEDSKMQKSTTFDTMGVTKADFDTRRPDPNNPAHHTAVDDFFKDLHKKEVKTIQAMQRKNEKKGR